MFGLQFRPTFIIAVADTRDEVMSKLEQAHRIHGKHNDFMMFGEYGELHVPPSEHRLWTPHLSFYVSEHVKPDGQHAVIHGRFAPRLEVWTTVWIAYLLMSFTAFFGFTLGYSQWMLGESLWGIFVAACSMLGITALYLVAAVGQQWSADQMQMLRIRLETILANSNVSTLQTPPPTASAGSS
ncbi:MAG: hypothetical protein R3C53_09160 [Pirellulaceae bacterium]